MTTGIKTKFNGILSLYVDGFRAMTVGKWLWALILVKLTLFFLLLKLFFFPNVLKENYDTDDQRAEAVRSALIINEKTN